MKSKNYRANFNRPIFLFISAVLFTLFCYGCLTQYNLATKEQELIFISSDREEKLGHSISESIEKKFKLIKDEKLNEKIEKIGNKLVGICDRKDIKYYFKILDEDEVNAVSLPGGYIYINKGLIDKLDTDDELACVMAHEVGHIAAKHAVKRLQGVIGYATLKILISREGSRNQISRGADLAFSQLILSYSKEDELLADRLAVRYVKKAGYDPSAMLILLEKLKEIDLKKPISPKRNYRTHPYIYDRMRVAKEEIFGKIDFDDYINIDTP